MRLKNILMGLMILVATIGLEACGKRGNLTLPLAASTAMSEGAH